MAIAHSKSIIESDLREPEAILGHPEVRRLIDFNKPVGLLLVQVLHFILDAENPADLVKRLSRPLVSGSYLTIAHGTFDHQPASVVEAIRRLYTRATAPSKLRDHAAIRGFFDGSDLLEPGLVFTPRWRPDRPAPLIDRPEGFVGVRRGRPQVVSRLAPDSRHRQRAPGCFDGAAHVGRVGRVRAAG